MTLDLSDLRVNLDQKTERIVSRMKDRSRFDLNSKIYQPDAILIVGREGISLLEYAIEGLEKYHASLGRFKFPDQHALTADLPSSGVERVNEQSPITKVSIGIKEDMLRFYINALPCLCRSTEENPKYYGETAYCDADLLSLLNERINLGRYVAQSKIEKEPDILTSKSDSEIMNRLRNKAREDEVVNKAKGIAEKYELSPVPVETLFRWMIEETCKVELEYLKKIAK